MYEQFKITYKKGDLIYGLRRTRREYANSFIDIYKLPHKYKPYIDPLNDFIIEYAWVYIKSEAPVNVTVSGLNKRKIAEKIKAIKKLPRKGKIENKSNIPIKDYPRAYLDFLIKHKNSPRTNRIKQPYIETIMYDHGPVQKIVPRSCLMGSLCKLGIEFITLDQGKKIHFILDRGKNDAVIDQKIIVEKTDDKNSFTFTASELRYLCRLKYHEDVINNVFFWEKGKRVDFPWITDPDLWSKYKPKSQQHPIFKIAVKLSSHQGKFKELAKTVFSYHYSYYKNNKNYDNQVRLTFQKKLLSLHLSQKEIENIMVTVGKPLSNIVYMMLPHHN